MYSRCKLIEIRYIYYHFEKKYDFLEVKEGTNPVFVRSMLYLFWMHQGKDVNRCLEQDQEIVTNILKRVTLRTDLCGTPFSMR